MSAAPAARYACRARACATRAFDVHGFELEITDPSRWRASGVSRVAVENQFSSEIDGVRPMSRDEDRRVAVRIEFARLRLAQEIARHVPAATDNASDSASSPIVRRRRLEWHALRLEMVERNLYLVLINVERYGHTSAEHSDLIQAGAAALFRAIDGFDWRRGVLFKTYAIHWLNERFRSHLYNFNSTVRVPVYLLKSIKHVNAAIRRLRDPHASVDDIARESGLRRSTITSARTAARRIRSLDEPLENVDGARTLASDLALQDDDGPYSLALEDLSIASGVEAEIDRLTDRERLVVKMRFGIGYRRGHIYAEIAQELGVSVERVRQILVRALTKMRTPRLRRTHELLVT